MRTVEVKRDTKETKISLELNLDGTGSSNIKTGIPFFDHMLSALSKHSGIELNLQVEGDLEVDFHHTIEDTGIVVGSALAKALGDKRGVERFADATVPLDEALSRVVIDLSGRPYLDYNVTFVQPDDGTGVNPYLFEEFFRGLVNNAAITLHIDYIKGRNSHHVLESTFKAFGRALKKAVTVTGTTVPSTKGVL